MKKFKGISLRLRLTLLTATIMLLIAGVLTAGSITRADSYFVPANYIVTLSNSSNAVAALDSVVVDSETKNAAFSITPKETKVSKVVPMTDISLYSTIPIDDTTLQAKFNSTVVAEPAVAYQLDTIKLTSTAKKSFASSSTWMMLIVMIAGVILTWFMAGRALKPVTKLASAVDTIDAHNLSTRITNIESHDEIQRLTDSFNHMLDKLEQAFDQQRTFAANAAHELKTPLAAIRTNLEVLALEENPSLEEYQDTVSIISRNSERLIALVGNLLELNDQQNIDIYECISTEKMITQILSEQVAVIEDKNLTITVNNQLPKLYGNGQLLTSALRNLLENAVKYQNADGQICITLQNEADTAQIIVWDDGPGISTEQLPHIFAPFYRCDPSRSSQIKGSGLGLALVQTIVERHNGTIIAQSSPEDGTSFTITLPNQVHEN